MLDVSQLTKGNCIVLNFTEIHLILHATAELGFVTADYQVAPLCWIKMGYLLIQLAANFWKERMEFSC